VTPTAQVIECLRPRDSEKELLAGRGGEGPQHQTPTSNYSRNEVCTTSPLFVMWTILFLGRLVQQYSPTEEIMRNI
jgi:hypothetical protein